MGVLSERCITKAEKTSAYTISVSINYWEHGRVRTLELNRNNPLLPLSVF